MTWLQCCTAPVAAADDEDNDDDDDDDDVDDDDDDVHSLPLQSTSSFFSGVQPQKKKSWIESNTDHKFRLKATDNESAISLSSHRVLSGAALPVY